MLQGFCSYSLELLKCTDYDVILENEINDVKPHSENWYKGNIAFIGDAIHATTPNLAQGACQAIEDAYTLGLCLKNYPKNPFSTFQNARMKKVKFVVNNSWSIGKMSLTDNALKNKFFYSSLKYFPESFFQNRYKRIANMSYLERLEEK